ncbi:sterol desaturase family protein [Kiloniella laminariae]|uniref:Sterol desaturase family protein n=1 Tax=Kiloniella laminariae TaxID=454162 RepID=A0ABT4LM97_9PROT|nr:sterol desaturase family protein [Kiloniella laminariae]MCZ4282229.1 sterol desaturase family protein [Kiloniella laminariae]
MNTADWVTYIEYISFDIYDWTLLFALLFLTIELLDEIVTKRLNGERILETISSCFTQIPYYFSEAVIFGIAVYGYFTIYEYIPWQIPTTGYVFLLVLLLADFTYYVEHYFAHKIRLLWLAHSVHHSSTMMNTATAFRFSIFDPVMSAVFHLPLLLLGFNPIFIFGAEVLVQAYQFWIHNEMVGKLGPLEWIFNTPSHHRVHHGSDRKYLDKNFGGILIIWDRLFQTYQKEEELPTYGLTIPMTSKNPITVQFHEFINLYKDLNSAKTGGEFLGFLLRGPGWKPLRLRKKRATGTTQESFQSGNSIVSDDVYSK